MNSSTKPLVLIASAMTVLACTLSPSTKVDNKLLHELPEGAGWHYLRQLPPGSRFTACSFEPDGNTVTSSFVENIDNAFAKGKPGQIQWRAPKSSGRLDALNEFGELAIRFVRDDIQSNWFSEKGCYVTWIDNWESPAGREQLVKIFSAARNAGIRLSCLNIDC